MNRTPERFESLVGARWIGEGTEAVVENPSDLDSPVGVAVQVGRDVVGRAVSAAREGGESWRALSSAGRADLLECIGSELLSRASELGCVLALEEGKTLAEATGEVARAGQIFRFFSGEAVRAGGELIDSVRPGVEVESRREPVGVVVAVTPWNFPVAIPAWKVAPALAYGNSVILKPAGLVPASAAALADIIHRAGVPAGAFNLLIGRSGEIGDLLVRDPGVDAVTFTGSVEVGAHVRQLAGDRGARVQLEMGGKNPLVVLDDADLDVAVDCAVQGAFHSTGQRCTASSRLIVTDGIHDAFVERVVQRVAELRVGHALAEDTTIGPVVDQRQFDQDLDYLDIGRADGATLAAGGDVIEDGQQRGWYLRPALFIDATNAMRICREEIFGPIAAVIRVDDYEQAIAVANDTEFGLCAGICTRSLAHAVDFKRRSQSGMVMINLPTAGVDYHVGFGGRKGSSYGPREQGSYAREFYTQHKTVYANPGSP
jgi:alpha-ketoglutaric semialdehyde dehydrogenase